MSKTLHTEARDGSLTRTKIRDYIRAGTKIDDLDSRGFTALALASQEGRDAIVRAILYYGADVNKETADGRTPLYLAAGAPRRRAETVQELLKASPTPNLDAASDLYNNDTPLMVAVSQSQDPDVVKLLVDAGASTSKKNSRGQSAQSLADQSSNPKIRNALLPKNQQGQGRAELTNFITNFVLFVLAYFNTWDMLKDVIIATIRSLYNITAPSQPDTGRQPDIDNPKTARDFMHNLENLVKDFGLEEFFSDNDPYLQKIADKAAELRNDPNNSMNNPEDIGNLMHLALYQPILYLDDSGSMKGKAWEPQKQLVERMTRITSKADPEKKGIHLRFINRDIGQANSIDSTQVVSYINQFQPEGSTKLGTRLSDRILSPLIYRDLNADDLKRPYLVLVITDGQPNEEPDNAFIDAIDRCGTEVQNRGYNRSAVRFSLSQIGSDLEAEKFLDRVLANRTTRDILYVTTDRLDDKYEDLRDNEKELDQWLLRTMIKPVKMKP